MLLAMMYANADPRDSTNKERINNTDTDLKIESAREIFLPEKYDSARGKIVIKNKDRFRTKVLTICQEMMFSGSMGSVTKLSVTLLGERRKVRVPIKELRIPIQAMIRMVALST